MAWSLSLNAWEVRASLDAPSGGRGLVLFDPHSAHGGWGQKTRDSFSGVHDSLENVSGFPATSSMDKEVINPESVDMRMFHIPPENLVGFAPKKVCTV